METVYEGKYTLDSDSFDGSLMHAKNNETGESVALKRIPAHREEALIELRIWRDFYPDVFRTNFLENGWLYIERAWIDGETLYDFLEKNGRQRDLKSLRITLLILQELKRFYDKTEFVHGDLNLTNIIYDSEKVRIIDFESAGPERNFFEMKKDSKKRTLKFVTEGFSAPEKFSGEVSYKSDFYSVGVILEALGIETEIARNIKERLSAKNPDDRYDTVTDAIRDVEEGVKELEKSMKSLLFKNTAFGYRKLILYIPDNFSFASELAGAFSENGINTGCLEICDFSDGIAKYHFAKFDFDSKNPFLFQLSVASEPSVPYGGISSQSDGLLSRNYMDVSLKNKLRYGIRKVDAYDVFDLETMRNFIVNCYTDFDVTIVCDERFVNSDNKAQLMRFSDYCIIAPKADIDVFESAVENYLAFMEYNLIPKERLLVTAWDYEESESAGETVFCNCGATYIGKVSRDSERSGIKNLKGGIYSDNMPTRIREEYNKIIAKVLGK